MSHPSPTRGTLHYGSVCSGIEAVSLAWQPLGMQPDWFAEIEPFPCAVLAHHHPEVPNLGDMTQIAARIRNHAVPAPDILVGGTPCQSFSVAGARHGLADPRGALTLSYVELAHVIDHVRHQAHRPPVTVVWENVPGVLSDRGNAFGCMLGALAGEDGALEPAGKAWTHAGFVAGPRRRIAWRVLDAQYFGVAQRRRRVFLVASGRNDLDPAAVLFESAGLLRHPAPGFAPWQDVAAPAASRADVTGGFAGLKSPYGPVTIAFAGGNSQGPVHVGASLTAKAGFRNDFHTETYLVQSVAGSISHTLDTANGGKGCGEDGSGRGVPVIAIAPPLAFAQNSRGELRFEAGDGQVAGVLSTGGGKPGQGTPMIVSVSLRGRAHGINAEIGGSASPALRASSGGSDKSHVLAPAYAAHYVYTAQTPQPGDWLQWRVRRLMPVECERLQGMPDNHTLVPYRSKLAADSPRYKAIGNSMAVPCLSWLGHRLRAALR
jgi:DNA (cytosine-5)-methyltransferase 1